MRSSTIQKTTCQFIRPQTLIGAGVALAIISSSTAVHAFDVTFGGYVKADFIYDLDQDLGDSLSASSVNTGAGDSNASFRAHAKQTRFNITGEHENYTAKIEADFFTNDSSELVSNSRHLRLRHAYVTSGNLLVGQTWSTFMDKSFIAYPSTVDFAGPAGVAFARQTQLRWSPGSGFEFAIENPETRILNQTTRDTLPDIIARYDLKGESVNAFIAGIFRQYEVADGVNEGESTSDGGLHAGINMKVGSVGTLAGNVIINGGRYTYYGFSNPEAVIDADGDLQTVDEVGAQVFYEHVWGGQMNAKSTISYGLVSFDDEYADELGAESPEQISTFHLNYRWSPLKNVNYSVEASVANRENFNGADGDATRLQFGAQYIF